jgi:hypothetical protein
MIIMKCCKKYYYSQTDRLENVYFIQYTVSETISGTITYKFRSKVLRLLFVSDSMMS